MQSKPATPVPANDNEPQPTPIAHHRRRPRNCLHCGGRFRSQGPFNRICDTCKADEAWQSGEDLTLELPPRNKLFG